MREYLAVAGGKMGKDVLQIMENIWMQARPSRPAASAPRRSQRRRERLLARSQEQLALLDSEGSIGFWRWNRATERAWASAHGRNILELDVHSPLTYDTLFASVNPDDRMAFMQAICASAQHNGIVEMQLRVLKEEREVRWITAKACTYRDEDGIRLRVVGCVIDDTGRKRAQLELLNQKRQITHLTRVAMLGALSGALAHELQQPLTSILSNAQAAQLLAAATPPNVAELQNILRDIVNEDKHAGQIIQHLRSLLMRGDQKIQPVAMTDLIPNILKLTHSTLTERGVHVQTRFPVDVPSALGDPVALQQVLLNLILNACDAMSTNPAGDRSIEIIVTVDIEQTGIRTSVVDCGKGIAPDQCDGVFDPFFTTKGNGLGLGLAVSRSIIASHNGRLWATNNSDRGATFHFTLPAAVPRDRK
jgi:C4-dicarboxylate-specific signal transduction histidine kinase